MTHIPRIPWAQAVRQDFGMGAIEYTFPVRPLGMGKLIGLIPIGFGLSTVWGPALSVGRFVLGLFREAPHQGEHLAALLTLPVLLFGMIPILLGLVVVFGYTRVHWEPGRFRVSECLGPLRWTRSLSRRPIRQLVIHSPASGAGAQVHPVPDWLSILSIAYEDGRVVPLMIAYPKDWLSGFSQDLKARIAGDGAGSMEIVERVIESHREDS